MPADYDTSRYGVNPETFRIDNPAAFEDFIEENPEWAGIAGQGISFDAAIVADAFGLDPADQWDSVQIWADGDEWGVTVTDKDGGVHTIDLGPNIDLAWDYYDAAAWYDYDVDKDIDTGDASESA